MLHINYPEMNVNSIEQKIRYELHYSSRQTDLEKRGGKVDLTSFQEQISYIQGFIKTAESRAEIRKKLPQKLEKFPCFLLKPFARVFLKVLEIIFKDQREINFNLLIALKESLKLNERLLLDFDSTQSDSRQNLLNDEILFNHLNTQLNQIIQQSQSKKETLNELIKKVQYIEEKQENCWQQTHFLRYDLNQQKRLMLLFFEEAKKRLPEPFNAQQLQKFVDEKSHFLDAFYVAFEDKFRGSREEIKNRQQTYLSVLTDAKIDKENSLILDLGCGRGEWLELLKSERFTAQGIELNKIMVELCCSRGLDVLEGDAVSYLQSLPDASVKVITGFHIIEHLAFVILLQLFDEVIRVLQPGGCVIFETPNPENVWVSSHTFYFDPTHRHPLPSQMIKFVAEYQGLYPVNILNLNPMPDNQRLQGSDLADRFNQYFYSSQDYAIIGYKV